jgi:hypothetical protein
MIPEQRHREILRLLRREGVLSIRSLTDYMNEIFVRRPARSALVARRARPAMMEYQNDKQR